MMSRSELLQLLEMGRCRMQIKGGMVYVTFREIYITSNWEPKEWFPEKDKHLKEERSEALYRRCQIYNVTREGVTEVDWIGMAGNTSTAIPRNLATLDKFLRNK